MKKQLLIAAMMPALIVGCSKDEKPNKLNGSTNAELLGNLNIQEVQILTIKSIDGKALAGAQVLIGDKLGSPFANNFLTADSNGQITLPTEWTSAETITIQAPGYLRSTYLNQNPGNLTIALRPIPSKSNYEVTGVTSGHNIADKDGFIDFGLVIPALSRTDLLSFDMDTVISPQEDVISAVGQEIRVPANVTLPRQKESYGIFPVTLEKPTYRMSFNQLGVTRLFAARGRFPFKEVVSEIRGGADFVDLINSFKIAGGGIRDIEIKDAKTKLDIPTRELNFTEKRAVAAPTVNKGELFIAVSVAEMSGYLLPTDVKKVASGKSLEMALLPDATSHILGVVKKDSEMKSGKPGADRLSATILPFVAGTKPTMLPLIPNPTLLAPMKLQVPIIGTVAGVNPIATYSLLSTIEEKTVNGSKTKVLNRFWEVYGEGWQEKIELPEWPSDKFPAAKRRWEVTLVGSQNSSLPATGPAMIEAATHVTHSSLDF